jgi:SAM-dependent methyltransferase
LASLTDAVLAGDRRAQDHARTADAFSAVSALYDGETETNPMVRHVRRYTLRRLRALFRPGDLVLELGCGTGVEAVALSRAGIRVVATDVAPGMLEATTERVAGAGMADRVALVRVAASDADSLLDQYPAGSFAGAYSSFGPLNCEPDLAAVAAGLHSLIRPGGRLAVSVINRYHPFETAWYALHGDLHRAARRWRGYAAGTVSPTLPHRVPTYYYTPAAFARQFAPRFRPVRCRALLLLLPPPYLAHLTGRFPYLFRAASGLEARIAHWPVLRALGDHFYMELERV